MTSTTKKEAAALAAASTPRSAIELAALRLRDGVVVARAIIADGGPLGEIWWSELDDRLVDLITALPQETPPGRGKTLRGGPPAFGRLERRR